VESDDADDRLEPRAVLELPGYGVRVRIGIDLDPGLEAERDGGDGAFPRGLELRQGPAELSAESDVEDVRGIRDTFGLLA
jgi:hypothetical protein